MGTSDPGTSDPAAVVRYFFEAMEARDWDAAGVYLSPDLVIEYTATGERFVGGNFLAMNRAYPEGWAIRVVEVLQQGDRAAAQVSVAHGDEIFWCAGFYTVIDGLIVDGVEHWITEGFEQPPEWRQSFTA